jgi:chromosome partitioning protein
VILTVGNTKGGVGKTTIAVNAAIVRAAAGRDVLSIDGDEQQTAITFTELRSVQLGQPGYTAVSLQGSAIRTQVRQLAAKYDDIIIDVGGRDTGSLRAALTISETFLIPVLPRSFDIWAVDQVAELARETRETLNPEMRACIFLNAADAQGHGAVSNTRQNWRIGAFLGGCVCTALAENTPPSVPARHERFADEREPYLISATTSGAP